LATITDGNPNEEKVGGGGEHDADQEAKKEDIESIVVTQGRELRLCIRETRCADQKDDGPCCGAKNGQKGSESAVHGYPDEKEQEERSHARLIIYVLKFLTFG
jgi:hypothetical protein